MPKQIIIKNSRQLALDYALLCSFLTLNNILSYHGIMPLSVCILILVLTLFFHHKLVKKEIKLGDIDSFKFTLLIFFFLWIFVKTSWFIDMYVGMFFDYVSNAIRS